MKELKQPRHGHLTTALALVAGALGVCAIGPAHAALGSQPLTAPQGATAANAVVHAATGASGASASAAANYSVRTTTLASGTVINEYVSSGGTVFGIAWRGPRVPDLSTLLGSYFPQYKQGLLAQRAERGGRGAVSVEGSDLVVHSSGHMGAFAGNAYLPQSLPAGVSASDIQ
ncbi:DUF2844 domain-containing protein [Caballeronia sp. Lep1P3]|uniref:DUF2844 domain-containing protein n=1 Tax=Caballeronia sp. Lep1P3 TaxID=2878150 RepID=UPI001FCFFDE0|nr:DUF2844 domain-containing protein [Caballeronia sp. Lep1P3]